jgi:prophage regulatory protein
MTGEPAAARGELLLVGVHEIGVRFGGIGRRRADRHTRRAGFPAPVAELVQGRVWLAEEVDAWWVRRAGRVGAPDRVFR